MDNELKDIAERLCKYSGDGWEIIHADKLQGGDWNLTIRSVAKDNNNGEVKNDNN